MGTEYYLFHILGVTSETMAKLVDSKGFSLSPRYLANSRSKVVI